jgi:ABC-2 type transport system permease protein
MTALTHPAPFARPALPRLTAVELRKMIDTRAGFWLLLLVGLSAAAAVIIVLAAGEAADQTMAGLFGVCIEAVAILLPVVGLLCVTSEWSQRTALTTFTLVPERARVVTAKLLAGCGLALAAVLACLTAAAAGNLIAGGSWSIALSHVSNGALYQLIGMLGALALGLLLMHSALALVTYFVAPTIVAVLVNMVPSLSGPAEWFDQSQTMAPLADDAMGSGDWARLAVSTAIWVGVPLLVGLLRLRRHELS